MAGVYSNLKFVHYYDRIEALQNKQVAAPVHVRVKPINHCNHGCWYCAYRDDGLQLGDEMDLTDRLPYEKMVELVDDFIDMGVRAVTFSGGGEPLLYKSLPEHIARLSEAGIKVASLTNGSNLKGKMAEAFARYGTWVRVSIDAWDDESYAKARSVKVGEFSRVIDNIQAFNALNSDCVLGVSYIIGKENAGHIYDVCKLFRSIGVDHVKLSGAVVSNEVVENNRYHKTIMQDVTREIKKAETLNTSDFHVVNHYHELDERFVKSYQTCPFMMFLTVIGADQCVYSCQDKAYTEFGRIGSLEGKRFKDFWFSEEVREHLYSFNPNKKCSHHCVAHEKNLALTELITTDVEHCAFV